MTDADALRSWIGRTERRRDTLSPWPLAGLAATLDREDGHPRLGDPLPPGAHWLYFLEAAPMSRLGPDGHPQRGGFLPPVALPRRMWAGGRLSFLAPLRAGDDAERVSEVADITVRTGRTGELVFVMVRHTISGPHGVALVEEHDIVYRDHLPPGAAPPPQPAPADAAWSETVHPSPTLLFRYSALTFNGHRIHYDRRYAMEEEGYPGLVVHGPLMATLLLDFAGRLRPGRTPARFAYRVLAPVFDTAPFTLNARPDGDGLALWVAGPAGELALWADAVF
ncbi:FAS1-like dehydratase domain-containing protein [Azospirillum sp.]|uniref:FAS1-like dehydratase domain-containing protein n=1 Tax=Azospirillum sp. TaxID=34012 RepID=UPI003D7228FE